MACKKTSDKDGNITIECTPGKYSPPNSEKEMERFTPPFYCSHCNIMYTRLEDHIVVYHPGLIVRVE